MSNNEVKQPTIVASFKVTSADGTVQPCNNVGLWANSNTYDGMTRGNHSKADAPSEAQDNGRRGRAFAHANAARKVGYGLN